MSAAKSLLGALLRPVAAFSRALDPAREDQAAAEIRGNQQVVSVEPHRLFGGLNPAFGLAEEEQDVEQDALDRIALGVAHRVGDAALDGAEPRQRPPARRAGRACRAAGATGGGGGS